MDKNKISTYNTEFTKPNFHQIITRFQWLDLDNEQCTLLWQWIWKPRQLLKPDFSFIHNNGHGKTPTHSLKNSATEVSRIQNNNSGSN